MSDAPDICHVTIRGLVQRVGYRNWTELTALRLGLEGWVRNRRDGSVEALFVGPFDIIEAMLQACQEGPPKARVEEIDGREGTQAEFTLRRQGERFSVLPTE
jgi:acylphosphatase